MSGKKQSHKASSKKLTVAAPATRAKKKKLVSISTDKLKSNLDDKTFKKEMKQFMNENETLMKNLSKR